MKGKFLKALSILLSLLMAFSVCSVVAVADETSVPSYYVKYGGTGDGTTKDTPAGTVAKVIAKINADGLGAGDTANVYIMQDEALTTDGKATIDGTTNEHNITAWCDAAAGEVVPAYTAELVIQPYDTSITTYFAESTRYNDVNPTITLNGPTTLNCLDVVAVRSFYNKPIILVNGNDFTYIHSDGYASFHGLAANGSLAQSFEIARISTGRGTVNGVTNINLNGAALSGTFWVGSQDSGDKDIVHKEDVNITLDHPKIGYHGSMSLDIQLGGQNITFEKNLNVIVKDVADIQFTQGTGTVTVNGGVNYMVAPDETVTKHLNELTCFAEGTKIYTLKPVAKEVMDLFTFTDEAGTYKVADGKGIVATDEDGNQYKSENGILKVPESGVYSIDEYILPVTKEFFVKNGGTGDGTTRENPAASVAAVMDSIVAANLASRDTALITVLERDDWNAAPVSNVHNMAYIGEITTDVTPKVIIQGDPESATKVHLAMGSACNSRSFDIKEDITFKNLVVVITAANQDSYWYTRGHSLIFEEDTEFAQVSSGWNGGIPEAGGGPNIWIAGWIDSSTYSNELNYVIKGSGSVSGGHIYLPGNNYNEGTIKEDVNIILDNASIGADSPFTIHLGPGGVGSAGWTDLTAKFSKNINIKVNNASNVNFADGAYSNKHKITVSGGIQAILNDKVTYNTTDIASLSNVAAVDTNKVYVIKNTSGNNDIIDFTATAGTYKITSENIVYAVSDSGEEVYAQGDELILTPGIWTLNEKIPPKGVDYFVKYGGTGDGRSIDNPAPSVYAVTAAIAADLTAQDTAYVNIIQSDTYNQAPADGTGNYLTAWAVGTATAHTAKMVVQGYNGTTPYLAYSNGAGASTGNVEIYLYGPTVIQNVTLVATWGNYQRNIFANGYDITVEPTVGFAFLNSGFNGTNFGKSYGHIINATGYLVSNTYTNEQTITYNAGTIADHEIRIPSSNYSPTKHEADLNVVVDAANVGNVNSLPIYFGGANKNDFTSSFRNININIKSGKKVDFENGANANGLQFVKANAIQAILNPKVTYNTTDIASITSITDDTPVYVLKVHSDVKDAIGFTETAGEYTVNIEGVDAIATAADGTKYQSKDGILKVDTEGQYDITFIEEKKEEFTEYINKRGSNLQNTYKKLTEDKELTVVYFGGSVTNGHGVADENTQSWRGMIGNWLKNSFPNANITNINKACGESGTFLGSYRLTRDILSEKPDLLFLEYSINDYYDGASYAKSSYQYETIVRQVKEELPDCEIVTILVTDRANSSEAHKGNLHTQAQAHEDMAKIYNIPTLHVGRRLADELSGGWSTEVSIDNVHLTEYGNQLYYDVIHEYFANELIHGSYDGTMADDYVMPELQNEYLLDGDIKFIEPSQALVDRSEELGGTGITYAHAPQFATPGYDEVFNIDANADGTERILAIEFEGTELIGLFHNYSKDETFQISIDGGEYVTKNYYHMNPTTLVTGLDSGKHVARIKFNISASRSWQWLGAIFSRDAEKRTAKQYAIDVDGGNAYTVLSGENVATTAGTEVNVTLKADVPAGYEFTGWELVSGDVTLADATAETTTFKMTTAPVAVKANYKATTKAVTVNSGTADKSVANIGDTVTIKANAAELGYVFDKWVGNADFADATAETTTFTMPEEDVVVTATYKVQPDDGSTDVRDLVRLKKFLAGILPVIGDYADYNKDGVIDAADLVTLRKIIIGAIEAPTSTAIVVTEDVTIDEIIDLTGSKATDAIAVEGGVATINGGYYNGGQTAFGTAGNTAVWANGGDVVINDGEFTIAGLAEGDTGHIDLIYAKTGTITINGGFFYGEDDTVWVLNCNNANYKNGTANIVVYGGTFVNFDPSNSNTEPDDPVSFVADGYTVVSETQANGDVWYTVVAE